MSTTNVAYSGKVDVRFWNQSRLYKNNGGVNLWKLLCDILAGKILEEPSPDHPSLPSWKRDLPGGIHLLNTSSNNALNSQRLESLGSSVLTETMVPVDRNSGKFYSSDQTLANYQAQFTGMILPGHMRYPIPDSASPLCIALVSSDNSKILAAVDADSDILSALQGGAQVNVSWTIGFENEATAASAYLIDLVD